MKSKKHKLVVWWDDLEFERGCSFDDLYHGNFFNLLKGGRVDAKQIWDIKIDASLIDCNGGFHKVSYGWSVGGLLSVKQLMGELKNVKIIDCGIETRWQGISRMFYMSVFDDCGKVYKFLERKVTCTCYAKVKPQSVWNILNKMK